ncbi:glycosyltransferase family 4 protein [Asanoa sp. NPDC050611]|uniref:glycosyltransferase family 4 protein n=1 Tax=Asanoa sp. NPDC050611 TaxID=3157098 RepID=UPI00340C34B3
MLVDNGVHGDSRVQKVARSAAEAGWDVVLLGLTYGAPVTWRLGGAEVRLLAMPDPLARASAVRKAALRVLLRRRVAPAPPPAPAPAPAAPAPAAGATVPALSVPPPRSAPPTGVRSVVVGALRRAFRPYDHARTRLWLGLRGERAWRQLDPSLWDYEDTFGPVVDDLAPDLIHAHDFRMIGVGARAKARAAAAGRQVKLVWDAHEFLPGIRPRANNARWLPATRAHEREYAPYADAVITVSETLADLLIAEHGLTDRPAIVLNAPAADSGSADAPDLRVSCGIGADVPLLVYSGAAGVQRGLDIMVEALPRLPEAHVAFVVSAPPNNYVRDLVARAAALGVGDRLHVLPYVSPDQVVGFLSGADAGVIPIHHWPNHEIALITKFFEYAHARLPMVVSDVRTMADTVRAAGNGEVFRAKDLDDFVRAVRAVLADPAAYRSAYDKPGLLDTWTWEAQAEVLDKIYRELLPAGSAS